MVLCRIRRDCEEFLGALVNAVQLFLCDRLLFAKVLHTKGYLPYYAYILFFVLMFVATLIPGSVIVFYADMCIIWSAAGTAKSVL